MTGKFTGTEKGTQRRERSRSRCFLFKYNSILYNVLIIKITLHYSDSIYFQSNTTLACIFKITQNNGKKKRDEEEE